MRSLLVLAVVCVFLGLVSAPSAAQDAAPQTVEHKDPARMVAVQLPPDWEPRDGKAALGVLGHGLLGCWGGKLGSSGAGRDAWLDVFVSRDSRRAVQVMTRLTSEMEGHGPTRSGDGWVARRFVHGKSRTYWFRCVERAGYVVVIAIRTYVARPAPEVGAHAFRLLEAARVVTDPVPVSPPAGTTAQKTSGFDVWAGPGTKAEVRALGKALEPLRKMALKELEQKRLDPSVPKIWLFEDIETLAAYARTGSWRTDRPRGVIYLPHAGAIGVLRGKALDVDDTSSRFGRAVVQQALAQWFGGAAPPWLQDSLENWLAWAPRPDLDPREEDAASIERLKKVLDKRPTRLDHYLPLSETGVRAAGGVGITVAYQMFLRADKKAARWRKPYRAYLDAVRETGDPDVAAKVWEGTDFVALSQAFTDWAFTRR